MVSMASHIRYVLVEPECPHGVKSEPQAQRRLSPSNLRVVISDSCRGTHVAIVNSFRCCVSHVMLLLRLCNVVYSQNSRGTRYVAASFSKNDCFMVNGKNRSTAGPAEFTRETYDRRWCKLNSNSMGSSSTHFGKVDEWTLPMGLRALNMKTHGVVMELQASGAACFCTSIIRDARADRSAK